MQKVRIAKAILKNHKTGGPTLPYVKTCHKATVVKIVWNWCKVRQMDQ